MAYADEPNVISEKRGRKKYVVIGLGTLLFLLIVFSAVIEPWYRDFQRRQTPSGPHGGDLYFITLENRRVSMELVRLPPANLLTIFLRPARHYPDWNPANYRISYRAGIMEEPEFLDWHEGERLLIPPQALTDFDPLDPAAQRYPRVENFFGPSSLTFPSARDFSVELRIYRGDEVVWEGRRWSYGPAAHRH